MRKKRSEGRSKAHALVNAAYRIQSRTRHKSAEVVASDIGEAGKWTKSRLDGVGCSAYAYDLEKIIYGASHA